MSWVVEEWKEGLPTKTLQKIQELESQVDKLKKERQQRQLQLESLEAAFQKQKQKVESEKSEVTALKRENQSLIELCDNLEKTRQKLSHEREVKEAQVSLLEGQLGAGKKQLEKLEQELRRYKNDLERSQQSFNAADVSVCVTPQKSLTVSFTPAKSNDSKYEELQEKYQKEVEERKKLETELKILQIKLMNQTPQPPAQSAMNHRDIARHQSSSSVFSWQQERTPSRVSSSSHDTSLKRNYTSIQYPWEQDETPSKRGFMADGGNRSLCEPANNPANDQLRNQNQELRSKVNDLELRLQVQEKELKSQLHKLHEAQTLLDKTQAALSDRDKTLTKSREDLARTTAQYEQSVDRCTSTEQKLKKVSEELICQRQNAESGRLTLEQKLREQEKENQQELLRQQNSVKNMEQQLNQMRSKLSQESQQAKNEINAIQAELDRVTHGKKMLEHEVEDLKQKLSRAEQAVSTGQNHVTDLKKELEESRSQQNAIKSQLDHKAREHTKLEDEFRTASQTLRQNQVFIEELKNKNNTLDAEIKAAAQKLNNQDSTSMENLKATVTNLEKERDSAKNLLQEREKDLSDVKSAHVKTSEELSTLKNRLHCKERECEDWIKCKDEYENNARKISTEKEEISRRIGDMEATIQRLTDQIDFLENDKKSLHTQIKTLQDIVNVRTADLEVQKVNCANLNGQMESESQKYQKEIKNLLQKISELEVECKTQEVHVWSARVSFLENELEMQKKLISDLQDQLDLLRNQLEIQKSVSDAEARGKDHVSNSTNVTLEPSVDSLKSVVQEKEEEITSLAEKLSFAKVEMEAMCQSNRTLSVELQELKLLSESWSIERETLSGSITCLQKEIEKLTEENKRTLELLNVPNHEKLEKSRIDTSERRSLGEDNPVDGAREENTSQDENRNGEVVEWKEKVIRFQQENGRLLRANEELSTLVGKLRDNEFSLNKSLEELRVCLKDKETSLRNAQTKLELLNRSEEEDVPVERVREQLIDLQNDSEQKMVHQDDPKTKGIVLRDLDETTLVGSSDGTVMDNSVLDITQDISLFPPFIGPQGHEENLTLLINMDHLSLAPAGEHTSALPDLAQLESLNSATLLPFTPPPVKQRVDDHEGRRSITSEIVDLLLGQSPQPQQVSGVRNDGSPEIKDLLVVYQMELSRLQKQHLSEIAIWQQKLTDQASEMEAKLSSEKAEVEQLTQELEAARLELQVFDLSARSLLSLDSDDMTMCTVLPIGRLSLGSHELQACRQLNQSPKVLNKSVDENITERVNSESPTEKEENSSRERKRRKGGSGAHVDNVDFQDASRSLHVKAEEEQKLSRRLTEQEEINQNLVAEIKDLSVQVEMLRDELLKKDQEIEDVCNKAKGFEVERSELLGRIELISHESANKLVEIEKELNNSLNAMEILNSKISELSSVQESLEISEKKWKEDCLQTEMELKRIKSEKANIENHALSLEAELDALQSKWQSLQEESEEVLRSFNEVRENLNNVVAEKCQLNQKVESLVEEKEELEQMHKKLKTREEELESIRLSSKDLIKILEAELQAVKEEFKAAKLTAEQLTSERDFLMSLKDTEKMQVEELQNQILKFEEEKKVLVNEQEDLQLQVSTTQAKNEKLSRALERCQCEKLELGGSLNSAQEEVTQMRTGIEKLKIKIEADERKKSRWMEKLKESERKFDKLNDRIESLERELVMSEENLENAILQTETAKEELEEVKEQKATFEMELKSLRKKLKELEEELQSNREKVVELEATIATVTESLENREIEHTQFMDNSKKQQGLLQAELEEILKQKSLTDQKYETAMAECAEASSKMEQEKEQLLQELDKAQMSSNALEMTLQKVTLEQEECKLLLEEKTRQLVALEGQIKDAEEREKKYSSQVSRFDVECENLRNSNKSLQTDLQDLEEKVRNISVENETLQATIAGVNASCSDLETQIESTRSENLTLQNKVAELEEDCLVLQNKLQEADLHVNNIQEQNCRERRDLDEELQAIRRQQDDSRAQLLTATTEAAEMKTSVASLQKELESQAQKHKEDIMEQERRLLQAESGHHSLLEERRKRDGDLASCQEKVTSLETLLIAHQQEVEGLRAANGRLSESLCKAQERLEGVSALEAQLLTATTEAAEIKTSVASLQKELESQAQKHKEDIMEQERRLLQAESGHHSLLEERRKRDGDLASCQEKVTSLETLLIAHQQEVEGLRAANGRLSESLCKAEERLEGVSALEAQLLTATTEAAEMKTSVASLQKELESQAQKHKEDIMEQERRLLQAESGHHSLLEERRKRDGDLASCQEKVTSLETLLIAHQQEVEGLRAANGRLSESLCKAEERLEGVSALEAQLLTATTEAAEMKTSVASLQKELESQAQKHKEDIMEQERRLLQAESGHHSLLEERRKRDGDLASCQEKVTSLETLLIAHQQEVEGLRAANGRLSESLCKAEERLEGVSALEAQLLTATTEAAEMKTSVASLLIAHQQEVEGLRAANGRLSESLCKAEERLEGVSALEAQLLTATTEAAEMKTSVASLQKELESQAQKHKEDIMEQERRLLQAESGHHSLLEERRKRDGDLASCQEKVTSLETLLIAHQQEVEGLRAANGRLSESLCKAEERLEGVSALEVEFDELKKKNAKTCSDLHHWMDACKELEGERGRLQERLREQEEALQGRTQKHDDVSSSDIDPLSEIEELKQCLEEKTLEANESIEKYCNLLIKTHRLEESNETLQRQVDLLRARLEELEAKKEALEPPRSHSDGAEHGAKNRRKSRRSTQGKQTGKRRRESENTGQNPSTPQAATKRVKKTGGQTVEEEFQPEGLPEVVKKGFSDIPSGKQSPFVLRRTAVPTRRSPRLSSQTNSPAVLVPRTENLENIPDLKSPPPGGSKSQLTKATEEDSAPMDVLSPLSAYVKMKSRASDNLCGGEPENERASGKVSHDETEEEGTCHVQ
ncbi:centromere protein F isoform 2-T2 [Anomaloglossus baeobatrachus]